MLNFKFKWISIILVSIILLLGAFIIGHRSNVNQVSSYENLLRVEKQKSKVWQDESGRWHSKAETAQLKSTEALCYLAKYDLRFANLSKDFDGVRKDLKNIQYAGFTGTQSDYTIRTSSKDTMIVLNQDTTHGMYFDYLDPEGWFLANGFVLKNGNIPFLHFSCRDSLTTVITKKRRLFRKAILNQEIKSSNPYTKITYNQSVFIAKRKRFLGIF